MWKKLILGEFSWWRVVRLPLIIYILLLLIGGVFPYKLIFPYQESSYDESLKSLHFIEDEGDHRIAYTYHKASQEKYLVLFFHGNAEDIGHLFSIQYELMRRGLSVMAIDYPGYGLSEGKPTEKSCHKFAQALYQEATQRGYTPEQILLWGRSVGSGVATSLATEAPHHALILESPFASAFTVKTQVPVLPFDKFNNLNRIKTLESPLFIIHGEEDKLISPRHSEILFHAHSGKKERHLVKGAGHNDLWLQDLEPVLEKLLSFIQ